MAEKRVAIVTGASRGIGAAVAARLSRDGIAVGVNYTGSADEARKVVDAIKASGADAFAIQADVSDPSAVAAMFDEVARTLGPVSVLVNNAGIMKLSPLAQSDDETFDRHIAVNLKGVFNCLRAAAQKMPDGGRIVNFSSSVVGLYQETYAIYAATKAGVEAMTHVLAKELRGRNITVNAVAPGPVGTELFLKGKPDEVVQKMAKLAPLERLGEPADIASVISLLVGPDGGWINGQVIRANGGII